MVCKKDAPVFRPKAEACGELVDALPDGVRAELLLPPPKDRKQLPQGEPGKEKEEENRKCCALPAKIRDVGNRLLLCHTILQLKENKGAKEQDTRAQGLPPVPVQQEEKDHAEDLRKQKKECYGKKQAEDSG